MGGETEEIEGSGHGSKGEGWGDRAPGGVRGGEQEEGGGAGRESRGRDARARVTVGGRWALGGWMGRPAVG